MTPPDDCRCTSASEEPCIACDRAAAEEERATEARLADATPYADVAARFPGWPRPMVLAAIADAGLALEDERVYDSGGGSWDDLARYAKEPCPRWAPCVDCYDGLVDVPGTRLRQPCPACKGKRRVDGFDARKHCGDCARVDILVPRSPANESCAQCLADERAADVLGAVAQVALGMLLAAGFVVGGAAVWA